MRHVTRQDLDRLAGQLTALGSLMRLDPGCKCKCKTKAEHAHHVAKNTYGAPGSNLGAGRSPKGDHADPTFAAVDNPDPTDSWWDDLSVYAHGASRFAQELARLVADLGTITSTSPKELSATGSGDCMACGRYCSGSVNDRLVAGMCDTDYRRWCRHGRPDRFEFCRNTPAHDTEVAS